MLRRFWWADVALILLPGALLFLVALSWQGHEGARGVASWALATFLLYAGVYIAVRLLLPRPARAYVVVLAFAPAVLSLIAGGLSLAAGYAVWLCVSAPSFGALFGAGLMRRSLTYPRSPAVDA